MHTRIGTTGLLFAVAFCTTTSAQTLQLDATGGRVEYQEDVTVLPSQSEWGAPYGAIGVGLPWLLGERVELRLQGAYWQSAEDTETWKSVGRVVQRNDLKMKGVDLRIALAYALQDAGVIRVTPYLALDYKHQRFERNRFEQPDGTLFDNSGRVDEEFDLGVATVGLDVEYPIDGTSWALSGLLELGYAFIYEADNSAFGAFDGEDGVLVEAGLGLSWKSPGRYDVWVGVVYQYQDMKGTIEDAMVANDDGELLPVFLELPDNELGRVGVEARWRVTL